MSTNRAVWRQTVQSGPEGNILAPRLGINDLTIKATHRRYFDRRPDTERGEGHDIPLG